MNAARWTLLPILIYALAPGSQATGIQPDSTIVLLSETDRQAQIGVTNTENVPVLLNVQVMDLAEDGGVSVFAEPSVQRVEPNGKQMVRLFLENSGEPLRVQHMKRLGFEGIPGKAKGDAAVPSQVSFNVRQIIPVIISPAGLKQDNEPWKFLVARRTGAAEIEFSNPSVFVVRLAANMTLIPQDRSLKVLDRTYILPGEKIRAFLPDKPALEKDLVLRIFPASPWGYAVPGFDIHLQE